MAITVYLDPSKMPSRTQDQSTFDANMAAYFGNLPSFGSQANALAANLNSIAFGGAYALPYTFSTGAISSSIGMCSVDNAAAPVHLYLNRALASGSVDAILQTFDDSTSVVKGYIKLTRQADASTWAVFGITALTSYSGYVDCAVALVLSSSGTSVPFADTDAVIVQFQRTGDKGDLGSSLTMLIRDVEASGTSGQTLTSSTWTRRTLNTVSWNDISGASLGTGGANTFRLPAGKFVVWASAPGYNSGSNNAFKQLIRMYNVTAGSTYDVGGPESTVNTTSSGPFVSQRPAMRTVLSLSTPTDFAIEHWTNIGGAGGQAASAGVTEIYTEVLIMKL